MTNTERYQVGTHIYYTGDRANYPSYGMITQFRPADRWGSESVDIAFDDPRWEGDEEKQTKRVLIANFEPGPGRRFWLADEYDAEREQKIAQMRRDYGKHNRHITTSNSQ